MRRSRAPNQNLSRQRSNSSNNRQSSLPTLDLHGFRRTDAIRRVTDWLEQQQNSTTGFVRIITGSGSHSQDGPVLRNAVQDLLMRRGMVFTMDAASFSVDPNSGQTFYPPPPSETDSKVIVVGESASANNSEHSGQHSQHSDSLVAAMPTAPCASLPRRHVSFNGVPANPVPSTLHRHQHLQRPNQQQPLPQQPPAAQQQPAEAVAVAALPAQQEQNSRSISDSPPPARQRRTSASTIIAGWKNDANHNVQIPDELDPDDDQVAMLHAREASLESATQELWQQQHDNALDRALQESRQEYATVIESEENLIEKALVLSQEQEAKRQTAQQLEEEKLLKLALEESQRAEVEQSERRRSEEERLLQQALEESEREVQLAVHSQKDEEDALQEALSRSLRELHVSDEEEERMIQKALKDSLQNRHS